MPALDGWCAVLANLAATARANWPGTIDEIDTEFLHELRVAVRRTRSILGHGQGRRAARRARAALARRSPRSAPPPGRHATSTCSCWSGRTTPARLGADTAADLEPVHGLLVERHRLAHGLLDVVLRSPATHAALDAWCAWLADPARRHRRRRTAHRSPRAPLGDVVAERIRKAHTHDHRQRPADHAGHPGRAGARPAQGRQEAALPAGVLRHAAARAPSASRSSRTLKVLQDNLGEHQDAEVHVDELRAVGVQAHRRGASAGDDARARASSARTSIGAAAAARTRVRRALRRVRHRGHAPGAEGDARRPRQVVVKIAGDLQHQGRRRQDHRRGQPGPRGRARTGARVLLWDLDPQGAATFFFRVRPVVKGGAERLIDKGELAAARPRHRPAPACTSCRPTSRCATSTCTSTTQAPRPAARRAARAAGRRLRRRPDRLPARASPWPARACSPPPTRCSCRRSRPRCRSARSTSCASTSPATRRRPVVLPFVSMFDRRKRLQRELVADARRRSPAPLPTAIPNASVVELMGLERAPVATYAPTSVAATAFRNLWNDIAGPTSGPEAQEPARSTPPRVADPSEVRPGGERRRRRRSPGR